MDQHMDQHMDQRRTKRWPRSPWTKTGAIVVALGLGFSTVASTPAMAEPLTASPLAAYPQAIVNYPQLGTFAVEKNSVGGDEQVQATLSDVTPSSKYIGLIVARIGNTDIIVGDKDGITLNTDEHGQAHFSFTPLEGTFDYFIRLFDLEARTISDTPLVSLTATPTQCTPTVAGYALADQFALRCEIPTPGFDQRWTIDGTQAGTPAQITSAQSGATVEHSFLLDGSVVASQQLTVPTFSASTRPEKMSGEGTAESPLEGSDEQMVAYLKSLSTPQMESTLYLDTSGYEVPGRQIGFLIPGDQARTAELTKKTVGEEAALPFDDIRAWAPEDPEYVGEEGGLNMLDRVDEQSPDMIMLIDIEGTLVGIHATGYSRWMAWATYHEDEFEDTLFNIYESLPNYDPYGPLGKHYRLLYLKNINVKSKMRFGRQILVEEKDLAKYIEDRGGYYTLTAHPNGLEDSTVSMVTHGHLVKGEPEEPAPVTTTPAAPVTTTPAAPVTTTPAAPVTTTPTENKPSQPQPSPVSPAPKDEKPSGDSGGFGLLLIPVIIAVVVGILMNLNLIPRFW